MNCQEITSILDDRDIAGLSGTERSEVEAHLHVCSDCARDWAVHRHFVTAAIPAVPVALAAQCRRLVSAQSRVGGDTQGRRRAGAA